MGGLTFGKVAADLIVNSITDFVCEHEGELAVQDLLNQALEYADEMVFPKKSGDS